MQMTAPHVQTLCGACTQLEVRKAFIQLSDKIGQSIVVVGSSHQFAQSSVCGRPFGFNERAHRSAQVPLKHRQYYGAHYVGRTFFLRLRRYGTSAFSTFATGKSSSICLSMFCANKASRSVEDTPTLFPFCARVEQRHIPDGALPRLLASRRLSAFSMADDTTRPLLDADVAR